MDVKKNWSKSDAGKILNRRYLTEGYYLREKEKEWLGRKRNGIIIEKTMPESQVVR